MIVDTGMYYLALVILAASLVMNIIMAGLVTRWKAYYEQYKGLWKEAVTRIDPCNPYEKQERSIRREYFEGLD